MRTSSIIISFLCLCLYEHLCLAAFYPIRQYGTNAATYLTTFTPVRRNTMRKETIPDWVQLYKKLENRHENTMRRNQWSFQKPRGGVVYPPQRDLRTTLVGKSPANNVMKPRDDLLLPRQPMMNYFYDKKQQRTPKQQLNIARLSYPSLNSMIQGTAFPSLLQHYKNYNFLRQQTSQSRTQLKKESSINGNLDKKSVIRGVVPYNTFYNTWRPVQTTWYTPYQQQQYVRNLIRAGFASPLNSYYDNQLYPVMNSNSMLYSKSYITNDMQSSVKKAFIPRSNIQAFSKSKERITLTKPAIIKNFTTTILSSQNVFHNKSSIKKSKFASVPNDNTVRKNKTVNPTSSVKNITKIISVARKRTETIHNISHQSPVKTTNNTVNKSPSNETVNISQRATVVGKHETTIKPSDAHYILSKKNRTQYHRHFFHKTENSKSANKRGFLSSPEQFEDEVGEFPIEEDPKTESTSEGIDSLNTLDQDQGKLQQPGERKSFILVIGPRINQHSYILQ